MSNEQAFRSLNPCWGQPGARGAPGPPQRRPRYRPESRMLQKIIENHGKIIETSLKNHRASIDKALKHHLKIIKKSQKNHRTIIEQSLKNHAKHLSKCHRNQPQKPSINQNEFHEIPEFQDDQLLTMSNLEGHGGGVAEGHWICKGKRNIETTVATCWSVGLEVN